MGGLRELASPGALALTAGLGLYLMAAAAVAEHREHHPHFQPGMMPPLSACAYLLAGTALCTLAAMRTQGDFRPIKTDARDSEAAGSFSADFMAVGHRGAAVKSDLKIRGM